MQAQKEIQQLFIRQSDQAEPGTAWSAEGWRCAIAVLEDQYAISCTIRFAARAAPRFARPRARSAKRVGSVEVTVINPVPFV